MPIRIPDAAIRIRTTDIIGLPFTSDRHFTGITGTAFTIATIATTGIGNRK